MVNVGYVVTITVTDNSRVETPKFRGPKAMYCGSRMPWFLSAMFRLLHKLSFSICSSLLDKPTCHSRPHSNITTSRKPSLCQLELTSPSPCWHLPCFSGVVNTDVGVEGAWHYPFRSVVASWDIAYQYASSGCWEPDCFPVTWG